MTDCLHQLVEAQAARTPLAVAVDGLGDRAEPCLAGSTRHALAHRLRELGVGPEVVVGVCMERSRKLMIALLGVSRYGRRIPRRSTWRRDRSRQPGLHHLDLTLDRPSEGCRRNPRSLTNHALAIQRSYAIQSGDRVLQFAAMGFGVLAEEVYPTLVSGATVVLGPPGNR
jgi:non-ribosomal peptide synthetase component F